MAPDDEAERRGQQKEKTYTKQLEYPRLEYKKHAQQNAADKDYLYRPVGFFRDIVIKPATYPPDKRHEQKDNRSKDQYERYRREEDVLRKLFFRSSGIDQRHSDKA